MNSKSIIALAVVVVVVLIGSASMFTVSEKEQAVLFALGKFKKADFEPGLHFKWPLVNNVRRFEDRIMTTDATPQRYLTKEQKPLIVDYFIKWRIEDVETYYKTMQGMESRAERQFSSIVNKGLLDAFGERTLQEVVSDDRADIMRSITNKANKRVQDFGIEIVDVRIKRIELTPQVFKNIYERMSSERAKEAQELRSTGQGTAEQIRAEAERKRTVMLANAYKQSQTLRGEGDARAANVYARAFNQNSEFYSFYRSLDAYRKSFIGKGNIMVMEPESEFFEYFKNAKPAR